MTKVPSLNYERVVRALRRDSWLVVRQRGSHRQYNQPTKPGTVTIAGKPGDEPPAGTVKSIFKQAPIERA